MQQNTNDLEFDLELLVKRFIRRKLSPLKPRDVEFTVEFLKKELLCLKKWISNKIANDFYKRYRLGLDTFQPLNDKEFYQNLPVAKFPMLFIEEQSEVLIENKKRKKTSVAKLKKEPNLSGFQEAVELDVNWKGFDRRPTYKLIEGNIDDVKKHILRIVKRYIVIMEFDAWISKKGLLLPQIELIANNKLASDEQHNVNRINNIIEKHFKEFIESKKIDDDEYRRLANLLTNFFLSDDCTPLSNPIKVKNRSTKMLASILGEIYFELENGGISYDYLTLGYSNINLFFKYKSTVENYQNSNLYKYYNLRH